jgi:tetratricopeptide (TPR) repeat protein
MNKRDTSLSNKTTSPRQRVYLPQFTRLFSALSPKRVFFIAIKSIAWILLLFLIGTNIALSHHEVALYFENTIRKILSKNTTQTNVLGTTNEASRAIPTIEELKQQYAHWEKIVNELPDYRDGHFTLATLAYQLGDINASLEHLMKVKQMDPNFPGLIQLEKLLEQ